MRQRTRNALSVLLLFFSFAPAESAEPREIKENPAARKRLQQLADARLLLSTTNSRSPSRFACRVTYSFQPPVGARHTIHYVVEYDGNKTAIVLILPGDFVYAFGSGDSMYLVGKDGWQLDHTSRRSWRLLVPEVRDGRERSGISFQLSEEEKAQRDLDAQRRLKNTIEIDFGRMCRKILESECAIDFGDSERTVLARRLGSSGRASIEWSVDEQNQIQIDSFRIGSDASSWISVTEIKRGDQAEFRSVRLEPASITPAGVVIGDEVNFTAVLRGIVEFGLGPVLTEEQERTAKLLHERWNGAQR